MIKRCTAVSYFGNASKHVIPGLNLTVGNDPQPGRADAINAHVARCRAAAWDAVVYLNAPDRPLWGGDDGRVRTVDELAAHYDGIWSKAPGADLLVLDAEFDRTADKWAAVLKAVVAPYLKSYPTGAWTNYADSPVSAANGVLAGSPWGYAGEVASTHQPINDPCLYEWTGYAGAARPAMTTPIGRMQWELNQIHAALAAEPTVPAIPWIGSLGVADAAVTRDQHRELMRHLGPLCDLRAFMFDVKTGTHDFDEAQAARDDYDAVADEWLALTKGVPVKTVLKPTAVANIDAWSVASGCQLVDGRVIWRVTAHQAPLQIADGLGGSLQVHLPNDTSNSAWATMTPGK